jgi:hypothetical protein
VLPWFDRILVIITSRIHTRLRLTSTKHLSSYVLLLVGLNACSSSGNDGAPPAAHAGQGGIASGTGGGSSTTGSGGGPSTGGGGSETGGDPGTGGAALTSDAGIDMPHGPVPDFGPNVLIFDASMPMAMIQSQMDAIITKQNGAQFSTDRYAYFFKPGQYTVDVKIGFYMQAVGLGQSPDEVVITGAVRSKADWFGGNATLNFWRAVENMSVIPTQDGRVDVWAVSQGTSFRRMHVKGPLALADGGFSSGGFVVDSLVDSMVSSGSQQQFFTRNTDWGSWSGGVWNMVFVGDGKPPAGNWPGNPYTVVAKTPFIREKPFLFIDKLDNYFVMVPPVQTDTQGNSWMAGAPSGTPVSTDVFYVATAGNDTATTLNAALAAGKHLLFTPGIYHLASPLTVSRAGTIVMGLGLTTLVTDSSAPIMTISDVDGVKVAGIIFDAGATESATLLQVGETGASRDHSKDPTALYDITCRVGGGSAGIATSCLTINSNNVIADNLWMWRADHGSGAGWTSNRSKNGLIVNGNAVTVYGLFVEHFQEYQTLWNGSGGRVFFYQSEFPYDPPMQTAWTHDGVNGYASYKVAPGVTSHEAWGLGVYSAFRNAVASENAVETPAAAGVVIHHAMTSWLNGNSGSSITHVINGTGNAATSSSRQVMTSN